MTAEALAQGARGATTEIFCPVQGFFQVPLVSDLEITVSPSRFCAPLCLGSRCLGGARPAHHRLCLTMAKALPYMTHTFRIKHASGKAVESSQVPTGSGISVECTGQYWKGQIGTMSACKELHAEIIAVPCRCPAQQSTARTLQACCSWSAWHRSLAM